MDDGSIRFYPGTGLVAELLGVKPVTVRRQAERGEFGPVGTVKASSTRFLTPSNLITYAINFKFNKGELDNLARAIREHTLIDQVFKDEFEDKYQSLISKLGS